ncbi:YggN family protein [bacterium]|nr:YggN family protein [bacterium]
MKPKRLIMLAFALMLAAAFVAAPAWAVDEERDHYSGDHKITIRSDSYPAEGVNFDFEDGTIYITNRFARGDEVEITREHDLFVNGEKIELTKDQALLVSDFYEGTYDILDRAKEIGIEGAKVGAEGAKVGLQAVHGVLKAMFTSYTFDEMEEDIERAAEKVEAKAERLEVQAEDIETMADRVEGLYEDMFDEIPALRELEWRR